MGKLVTSEPTGKQTPGGALRVPAQHWGGGDRRISGALWPASLDRASSSRAINNLSQEKLTEKA